MRKKLFKKLIEKGDADREKDDDASTLCDRLRSSRSKIKMKNKNINKIKNKIKKLKLKFSLS